MIITNKCRLDFEYALDDNGYSETFMIQESFLTWNASHLGAAFKWRIVGWYPQGGDWKSFNLGRMRQIRVNRPRPGDLVKVANGRVAMFEGDTGGGRCRVSYGGGGPHGYPMEKSLHLMTWDEIQADIDARGIGCNQDLWKPMAPYLGEGE